VDLGIVTGHGKSHRIARETKSLSANEETQPGGFTTRALHARPRVPDPHGSLRTPVYDSVAFEFGSADEMQAAFEGRRPAHAYSRISNPTVEDYEVRVTALAGALGTLAVSSGMAAITAVVMALAEAGTNIVTTRALFGNTISLGSQTLQPWGLEVRYVDMTRPEEVAAAIDDRTRLVFLEVITNPQLEVADVPAIVAVANGRGVPVVLDGTATTPYLYRSADAGVAVEVISATKYISGGATTVGGLIIDNGAFDWSTSPRLRTWFEKSGPYALLVALRREVYRNLGSCLSPHNAYLQALGLETLALRVDRSCANALALAHRLEADPRVPRVNYPGLPGTAFHATAARLLTRGCGGILTFELEDRAACYRVIDALALIRRATNVNDNKSLIIHPASTIFAEFDPAQRAAMGVTESLVRLSVGIEDLEDLVGDLDQALAQA
jgi:O-acetylhomoserine (thiol)-lyase